MDHIERLCRPTPPSPEPPPRDPDLIDGPRVPLRYGSAATEISVSRRAWRTMHHVPGRWIAIDDMTHEENLVGKLARVIGATCIPHGKTFVVHRADDGFLTTLPNEPEGIWDAKHLQVQDSPEHLNAFEKALADACRTS